MWCGLSLEGEGAFDSLASVAPVHLLPPLSRGGRGVGMGQAALALPGEAVTVGKAVNP